MNVQNLPPRVYLFITLVGGESKEWNMIVQRVSRSSIYCFGDMLRKEEMTLICTSSGLEFKVEIIELFTNQLSMMFRGEEKV